MNLWYAMTFRDELDMLKCQLIEHADRVHKFVIMEATVDHSGTPKDLVLQDHWADFAPWHDKIEYVVADWTPDSPSSFWGREQAQRDIGMPVITGAAAADDIVCVSDVDEFVPRGSWDTFAASGEATSGLVQKLRFAAVDWDGAPGATAVMARTAVLLGQYSLDTLRQGRESFPPITPGGYHFSWFGGPERIRRKAVCSPHQESLQAAFDISRGYAWERGAGAVGPGMGIVVEITDDYPQQVRDRTCPWYWWRPGPDNLPVDEQARAREVEHRASAKIERTVCLGEGREVLMTDRSAWHADDLTPCPTVLR